MKKDGSFNPKRILVIAPHPDDEILGCGGTIIKAVKNKSKVAVLYLTSGDSENGIREKEAEKVCNYLKINKYYFLRLQDHLELSGKNINKIIKILDDFKPDFIFINHDQDGDNDHKISYRLAMEASWRYNSISQKNKLKGILLYEVHTPMDEYQIVEDISNLIDEKMKIMAFYKSQIKKSRVDLAIKGLNRYRGTIHEGLDFAEVFKTKKLFSLFS